MRKIFIKDHLEKLNSFKVVVEVGSVSKAANILNTSQSSLSHLVMVLEEASATKLLERNSRGVRPTSEGKILYEFSKRLHLDVETVEACIASPEDTNSGHIRLATHETLAIHVWPRFIKFFKEKFPQIHISLISGRVDGITEGVLNNSYHLSVTVEPLAHNKLEKIPLYSGHFGLYGATKENIREFPVLRKSKVSFSEISDIPILTDSFAHIKQGLPIPKYMTEVGFRSLNDYEVNSFEAAIRLASQGLGIAAIPTRNADEAVQQKIVKQIRVTGIKEKKFGRYNICGTFRKDNSNSKLIGILIAELKRFFN